MDNKYSSLELLGVKEIQEIMHLSRDRTYALMRSEKFPYIQVGKKICVTRGNFEKWLRDNTYKKVKY